MLAFYSKLLLLFVIFSAKHPLHVSTTEINFNTKEKSLEISCRIFTDDFETILAKKFKGKVDLSKPEMHKAMDILVKKYLDMHLQYRINGKNISPTYIGFEKDQEATAVYLEIDNITQLKTVGLSNSILYDLFDDQLNLVHIANGHLRKSAKVNYPVKELSIDFNN